MCAFQAVRCSVHAVRCPGVGLRVRVYDRGVALCVPPSAKRGEVVGFSAASSRRFRDRLFEFEGDHGRCFSVTLTVRDVASPALWRRNLDVFSRRLCRRRDCGFWRVELQRRGTPHLHCLIWSDCISRVCRDWLQVWGVEHDRDHVRHACHITAFGGSAWLGYMAAHAIKHKRDQLGWRGRQWGIFSRSSLRRREMESVLIDPDTLLAALDGGYDFAPPSWVCSWTRFCGDDVQNAFFEDLRAASDWVDKNIYEQLGESALIC